MHMQQVSGHMQQVNENACSSWMAIQQVYDHTAVVSPCSRWLVMQQVDGHATGMMTMQQVYDHAAGGGTNVVKYVLSSGVYGLLF